jgi:hypothetical protein
MTRVLARTAALAMSVLAIPAATATQACAASDYTIGQFNMAGGNATYGEPGCRNPVPTGTKDWKINSRNTRSYLMW